MSGSREIVCQPMERYIETIPAVVLAFERIRKSGANIYDSVPVVDAINGQVDLEIPVSVWEYQAMVLRLFTGVSPQRYERVLSRAMAVGMVA